MNKFNKLLIITIAVFISFGFNMNKVFAAQDKINMTCEYVDTQNSKFVISITDSNIGVSGTDDHKLGGTYLYMGLMEGSKDFFYLNEFVDSNGKTNCPEKIKVATCRTQLANVDGGPSDGVWQVIFSANRSINKASLWNTIKKNSYSPTDYGAVCKNATTETHEVKLSNSTGEGTQTNIKSKEEENKKNTELAAGGCGFIGPSTLKIIEWIVKIIRIIVPVLIIVLGIVDFATIVFSGEDKTFKSAGNKFLKRLIAGIILIFIPYILSFLINLSGIAGDYDIDPDNMFCAFLFITNIL